MSGYGEGVRTYSGLLRAAALLFFAVWATLSVSAFAVTTPTVCIAPVNGAPDAARRLADPGRLDCSGEHNRYGAGDFVAQLRFAPIQAPADDPLVLRTTSVWQRSARIHFRYGDASEATLDYSSRDVSRFMTIGAIFEFPVPIRSAALETVFIETRGSGNLRGVVLGPQLMTRSESFDLRQKMTVLYSVFAGLALALIVYNLSLWAAMRHRFQLYYCAMVAAIAGYAFSSSGTLLIALPWFDNNARLGINYFLLVMTAAMALQFVRHFFGTGVVGARLSRTAAVLTGVAVLSTLLFAVLAPWQIWALDRFYFISLFTMLCLLPPMLFNAWRARSPYLWMFVIAWSAPFATSLLRAMHGFNLIGYSFWLDNGNIIAMAIEALLSSILVTMRLRELSSERDNALAGEQIARRLASTDPLTGLLNRRAFLDLAIGRKGRNRLFLIDIDNFKLVNDRLGHERGDEVLRGVAEAIQQARPGKSLAVRLGGEEFALLVPRSAFDDCTADTVLDAVRQRTMPQGAQVTVSIGFADGALSSEEDWKRLYRLADSALLRAKSDGRDRACKATDFRVAA